MNKYIALLFLNQLMTLPLAAGTLRVVVDENAASPKKGRVTLESDFSSRIQDSAHSSHKRFQAMQDKSKALGVEWKEVPTFNPESQSYELTKVAQAQTSSRRLKVTHDYQGLVSAWSTHAQKLLELKDNGVITATNLGRTEYGKLPGVEIDFPNAAATSQQSTFFSRTSPLCLLPLIGADKVPAHLVRQIGSNCNSALALETLELMKNVSFKVSDQSYDALFASNPQVLPGAITDVATLCSIGVGADAQERLDGLKAKNWIPADYNEGTLSAEEVCRYNFMTKVYPDILKNLADSVKAHDPKGETSSAFLNGFVEAISEKVATEQAELIDVVYDELLPMLVEPAFQDIPFFNPYSDYNGAEVKRVLTQTKGSWDQVAKVKEALFVPPTNSRSNFFTYMKNAGVAQRQSLTDKLGDLYLISCDRSQKITLECINSSATGIETNRIEGISRNPDVEFIDFASITFF